MTFGLDYVTGPPIDTLKAAGVTFVCRYLSEVNAQTQIKLLTKQEAESLSAAGIALVSNYEWYAERALEGEAAGAADAKIAEEQHARCGGPPDRPIYFSVDFDVELSHLAPVADYFRGVASVIGLHRTGAYGGINVLKYLFDAGLIAWGWQTYAWSGGQWEPRAHIQQYQNGVILAGHSVDYNRATAPDFGQWRIGEDMITPLSITMPAVAALFEEKSPTEWISKATKRSLHDAHLANYKANGTWSLLYLGDLQSPEKYLANGDSVVFFQGGARRWQKATNKVEAFDMFGAEGQAMLRYVLSVPAPAPEVPQISAAALQAAEELAAAFGKHLV